MSITRTEQIRMIGKLEITVAINEPSQYGNIEELDDYISEIMEKIDKLLRPEIEERS